MKAEAFLAAVAITTAFASGFLALSLREGQHATPKSRTVLELELKKFETVVPSQETIHFDALNEFANPRNLLPFFHRYSYQDAVRLEAFRESCQWKGARPAHPDLQKAWQFQDANCRQKELPEIFFVNPPFFHPSGHSYAFLTKRDTAWNEKHQNLFHVLELKEAALASLSGKLQLLANQEWRNLAELSAGESIVRTGKLVFLKRSDEKPFYRVYALAEWEKYWNKTPYRLRTEESDEPCFNRSGSVCWEFDYRSALFNGWNPLLLLFLLSVALTACSFALVASRIRRRQKDEERLKFALEMLTHELRTPLTVLHLAVDHFRSDFNSLAPRNQSLLLRIFDQVERLRRVAENSQRYLRKDLEQTLLAPKFTEINSLRAFVEHTLEPYLEQIELELGLGDGHVRTDPYWASICIKNIVENALKHGEKPVRVRVNRKGEEWSVEVEDHGTSRFDPGKRGETSTGLGLGLLLVRRILPHLNGELKILQQPTRVLLQFKEGP